MKDVLRDFIASQPSETVYHEGQNRGFSMGPVRAPEEVMADQHFHERGFFVEVEHPDIGRTLTYPGAQAIYGASPWRIQRPAPHIGEHNARSTATSASRCWSWPRCARAGRCSGRTPPHPAGWELETVMTDNGSEFRSRQFGETVAALGARQRFIQAGRPPDQRLRRAGAGHDPRGVLEAVLRAPSGSTPGLSLTIA